MPPRFGMPRPALCDLAHLLTWLAGLVSLAAIGCAGWYVFQNRSGHTGFEPWLLSAVFVPSGLLGVCGYFSGASRRASFVAGIAGLLGLGMLLYFDWGNILLSYDRWIERGMP